MFHVKHRSRRSEIDQALRAALTQYRRASLDECEKTIIYLDELFRWNAVHNLTARRDRFEVIEKDIALAAAIAMHPIAQVEAAIGDIGAGAGLLGVPLAILRPATRIVLFEARTKKTAFLKTISAVLGLENIEVIAGRIEQTALQEAERLDIAILRGVHPAPEIMKAIDVALRRGGRCVLIQRIERASSPQTDIEWEGSEERFENEPPILGEGGGFPVDVGAAILRKR